MDDLAISAAMLDSGDVDATACMCVAVLVEPRAHANAWACSVEGILRDLGAKSRMKSCKASSNASAVKRARRKSAAEERGRRARGGFLQRLYCAASSKRRMVVGLVGGRGSGGARAARAEGVGGGVVRGRRRCARFGRRAGGGAVRDNGLPRPVVHARDRRCRKPYGQKPAIPRLVALCSPRRCSHHAGVLDAAVAAAQAASVGDLLVAHADAVHARFASKLQPSQPGAGMPPYPSHFLRAQHPALLLGPRPKLCFLSASSDRFLFGTCTMLNRPGLESDRPGPAGNDDARVLPPPSGTRSPP